jgi:hypothetical protein
VHYSGKTKRHTLKTAYIVTANGRIAGVSPAHPGSRHDLTIRRTGPPLPKQARGYVDGAYQGYDKEHPHLELPYKKPKGGALTSEAKEYNRALSRLRVRVEHCIGRTKRFRIAGDRFRNPLEGVLPAAVRFYTVAYCTPGCLRGFRFRSRRQQGRSRRSVLYCTPCRPPG